MPDFAGILDGMHVPVLPLPNVVFFPRTLLSLHVLGPRHRRLLRDALAGNRFIAVALLREGQGTDCDGRPPIHPVGCLGRILRERALPDGCWDIVLSGIARVRIHEEDTARTYRLARVELLADATSPVEGEPAEEQRRRLVHRLLLFSQSKAAVTPALLKALHGIQRLGLLTDLVASALPIGPQYKQQLLEERNPKARLARLIQHLEQMPSRPAVVRPRKLPSISNN